MIQVRRALLSVFDKEGLVELGRELVDRGVELVSTGGTSRALEEAGLPVVPVSRVTGFPEVLGGRVKTLHPLLLGGILYQRQQEQDRREAEELDLCPVDLVVVNLYPFQEVVSRPGVELEEAVENIDIGGPTMIRSAAKNHAHVGVVVQPRDYPRVLAELREHGGIRPEMARHLATEAFAYTARYEAAVGNYFAALEPDAVFPQQLNLNLEKKQDLRYGENPHQKAAFYAVSQDRAPGASLARARQLQGKPLSYNNINDSSAAVQLVAEFSQPAVVAVKHANPCGVAVAATLSQAYRQAYRADPISIFGGIVALNREVDADTAETLAEVFLEVVIAPSYSPQALQVLGAREDLRLLQMEPSLPGEGFSALDLHRVLGGILVQEGDHAPDPPPEDLETVTSRKPTPEEWQDLLFAWRVVKHVKSNAIVIAREGRTLGVGAGQMNRVGAADIAFQAAGDQARGAVLASDAFFPMPDTVELAARHGIAAIIQPGGSRRDDESVAVAEAAGMAMILTGRRHFRH